MTDNLTAGSIVARQSFRQTWFQSRIVIQNVGNLDTLFLNRQRPASRAQRRLMVPFENMHHQHAQRADEQQHRALRRRWNWCAKAISS